MQESDTIRSAYYLQAIFGRGAKFRDFLAKFSHVNSRGTGGDEGKGQEESEGIPDSTQRSHSTIPSRFDAAGEGGCSRHVVSPTLCPFSTFRTAPALASVYTHTRTPIPTSEVSYPCRSCSLFVHPYIPLPIRARLTRKERSPRTSSVAALSTLVINTNCSIQTFKMCLTFLWHVIPSSPRSLF